MKKSQNLPKNVQGETEGRLLDWSTVIFESDGAFIKHYRMLRDFKLVREYLNRQARAGDLPRLYQWFYKMDEDSPPEIMRAVIRKELLFEYMKEVKFSDFRIMEERGMKILIQKNPTCPKYPLIYGIDKSGKIYDFEDIIFKHWLCIDVVIQDENIVDDFHAAALMMFYRLYSIRVKRIQKKCMMEFILKTIGENMKS